MTQNDPFWGSFLDPFLTLICRKAPIISRTFEMGGPKMTLKWPQIWVIWGQNGQMAPKTAQNLPEGVFGVFVII